MNNTSQLIANALEAAEVLEAAIADAIRAGISKEQAERDKADADQALCDDLTANGPAATLDNTVTPPVVTIYEAAPPSSYTATEIRLAG